MRWEKHDGGGANEADGDETANKDVTIRDRS